MLMMSRGKSEPIAAPRHRRTLLSLLVLHAATRYLHSLYFVLLRLVFIKL